MIHKGVWFLWEEWRSTVHINTLFYEMFNWLDITRIMKERWFIYFFLEYRMNCVSGERVEIGAGLIWILKDEEPSFNNLLRLLKILCKEMTFPNLYELLFLKINQIKMNIHIKKKGKGSKSMCMVHIISKINLYDDIMERISQFITFITNKPNSYIIVKKIQWHEDFLIGWLFCSFIIIMWNYNSPILGFFISKVITSGNHYNERDEEILLGFSLRI